MSETKKEMFQRLFPPRAAKVLDALRVAQHCLKSHMEVDTDLTDPFVRDVREALAQFPPLGDDVIAVQMTGFEPEPEPRVNEAELQATADGGASVENEIRWALDAIRRGDKKLAVNRLERCLGLTPADE